MARELLEESLRVVREVGPVRGLADVFGALGYVAHAEGDPATALDYFSRAAKTAEETEFTWWQVGMLQASAECLLELARFDEAEAVVRDGLRLAREIEDRQSCVYGLVHSAWIARLRGDEARAGLLWGAVEAEEARRPVGQWEGERALYAERVLGAGGEELERARSIGRSLPFEAALEEALA
jgi:tetratricopeptide (TPR) repeat protein